MFHYSQRRAFASIMKTSPSGKYAVTCGTNKSIFNKEQGAVKKQPTKRTTASNRKRYACQLKEQCCKCEGNRIVRINEELTKFHKEVLNNLNSTKGALLRMNKSIQAEGAFGIIKWNREYKRARRRGLKGVNFELALISCGFNLHKYHLKKQAQQLAA